MDDGAPTAPRVVANVGARLTLLSEEVVESQVGIGVSNGAVVDAGPSHHIWGVPYFILVPALVSIGAYFRSTGPLTAVG